MTPFEIWWQWYFWWMMTVYNPDEVRALRNLVNIQKDRIDRIEQDLYVGGLR